MLALLPFNQIPYASLAVLIAGMMFYGHAAREDNRSEAVYVLASIGSWIAVVVLIWPGLIGAIASQVLLFVGLTVFDTLRERKHLAGEARDD